MVSLNCELFLQTLWLSAEILCDIYGKIVGRDSGQVNKCVLRSAIVKTKKSCYLKTKWASHPK